MQKAFVASLPPDNIGSRPRILSIKSIPPTIKVGENIELKIEFSGNPKPKISLFKDDVFFDENDESFDFIKISKIDSGIYEWILENDYGVTKSGPINISVTSLGSEEIGVIYENNEPQLTDFQKFGSISFVNSGNTIQLSGGQAYNIQDGIFIGDIEDADEKMTIGIEFIAKNKIGSIAIGKKSTNPWYNISSYVNIILESGVVGNGTFNSNQTLDISINDKLHLIYKSLPGVVVGICKNITKGTEVSLSSSVDFYNKTFLQANTSRPSIFAGGAFAQISKVYVSRQSHINSDWIVIGDSKSYGLGVTKSGERYWEYVANFLGLSVDGWAGNGDRTIEQVKSVDSIIALKPKLITMFIGRNNYSSDSSSVGSDLLFMRNSFVNAGIKVIHILPAPENSYLQSDLKNLILTDFPNDQKIDPSIGWDNTWVYDGIHFDSKGHRHIADMLIPVMMNVLDLGNLSIKRKPSNI